MRVLLIDDEGKVREKNVEEILTERDSPLGALREIVEIVPETECRRCVTKRFIKAKGVLTEKGLPIFVLYDTFGAEKDQELVEKDEDDDE